MKKCDGCGRYFEDNEVMQCRYCGGLFCSECQPIHTAQGCNPNQGKVRCDDCGHYFDKSEVRKCHKCGAVVCHDCQSRHKCPSKQKTDLRDGYAKDTCSKSSHGKKPVLVICIIVGILILAGAGGACVATGTFDTLLSSISTGDITSGTSKSTASVNEYDIVGTWEGTNPSGLKNILIFESDHSLDWDINHGTENTEHYPTANWEYLGDGLYLLKLSSTFKKPFMAYLDRDGALYLTAGDYNPLFIKTNGDSDSIIGKWEDCSGYFTGTGVEAYADGTLQFTSNGMINKNSPYNDCQWSEGINENLYSLILPFSQQIQATCDYYIATTGKYMVLGLAYLDDKKDTP